MRHYLDDLNDRASQLVTAIKEDIAGPVSDDTIRDYAVVLFPNDSDDYIQCIVGCARPALPYKPPRHTLVSLILALCKTVGINS